MNNIYNLDYYEKMLCLNSKTAEQICTIRWNFVKDIDPKTVIDYGSGVGWFRAFRPKGIEVDTYDIGDFPQTGCRHVTYDLMCMWDVLEHISSFSEIENLLNISKHVAVTVPIKPTHKKLKTWKHWKPGEHLHYFTHESLDLLFDKYNFKRIKKGTPECPPREDIVSVLYEKSKKNMG